MNCPNCKYNLSAKARFCPNCGTPMSAGAQPQIMNKIIDYRELINKSTQGFVGRQWVHDAVDDFLKADRRRYFLLLGEPGSGKTAFMADLVRKRRYPHHFIGKGSQIGLASSLEWHNPVRFAESIGYQLLRDYGGWIMDWKAWGIHVNQRVRNLEGYLTGARIERFEAMPRPSDKPVLTVEQEIFQFGTAAQMIGVYVEKFVMDVEQIVHQLLTTPLKAIAKRWPEHKVVVLVDGLDEAEEYSNPQRHILKMLPNSSLPPNVRFLLASRPGKHLTPSFLRQVQTFWLSANEQGEQDARTIEDAKIYVVTLAKEEPVKEILVKRNLFADTFAKQVASASKGNFLYLYHYAQGVRDGDQTLLDMEALPEGLYGIYEDFLAKIEQKRDDVSWHEAYKPVLGTLAVAQEPLTRPQIANFTEVKQKTVGTILTRLKPFLDTVGQRKGKRYAIYHSSFGEYLISEENEDYIDGSEAHERIVAHYRERSLGDWPKVVADNYACYYLPKHLFESGQIRTLQNMLLNFDWLQAKLEMTGVSHLITDYRFLPNEANLDLVARAMRLSLQALNQDKTQLAEQLLGRLLSRQEPEIEKLLQQASLWKSGRSWLRPLTPSLTSPTGPLLHTLRGHSAPVVAVAVIPPEGKRVISASQDNTLRVWDLESGTELLVLRGHTHSVNAVVVMPAGHRAVSASLFGDGLKIWDLKNGTELASPIPSDIGGVNSLAATLNGERILILKHGGVLKGWDFEVGTELFTIHSSINAMTVTPNGQRIITISHPGILTVWDMESGSELFATPNHALPIGTLAMTSDGQRVIFGLRDGLLTVWDLEKGTESFTLPGHKGSINSVTVTADGKQLVSGAGSWQFSKFDIKVWDLEKRQELFSLEGHTREVSAVAITPNKRWIVSASFDHTLKVWDMERGMNAQRRLGHKGEVTALAVSPSGQIALSGSDDHTIKVWALERGTELFTLQGHTERVSALIVTPDGQFALSASWDNTLKLWDLKTGTELRTLMGHIGPVYAVHIMPNGRQAISASVDETLKLWNLETGEQLLTLYHDITGATPRGSSPPGFDKKIRVVFGTQFRAYDMRISHGRTSYMRAMKVTPDGRRAISTTGDNTLKVWDLDNKVELLTLNPHTPLPRGKDRSAASDKTSAITITSNGKTVISASGDNLKVWDLHSSAEPLILRGHTKPIEAIAVTQDGQKIVSASCDCTLKVWDLKRGEELLTLVGHRNEVVTVSLMPDERKAISTSVDNTLKVWDLQSGECMATFCGDGPLWTVAYTPDGSTIFAGEPSGKVHILRLEGSPISTPDHSAVVSDLNNLGALLYTQLNYADARTYLERALTICEETVAESHPNTVSTLKNLALLLYTQKNHAKARSYLERVMATLDEIPDKRHINWEPICEKLNLLLKTQSTNDAKPLYYYGILTIDEFIYGPKHPKVATDHHNLGLLFYALGNLAEARSHFKQAIAIFDTLDESHPNSSSTFNHLALLLKEQEEYLGAEHYFKRVLAIQEDALGKNHPDTISTLNNLEALLYEQGDYTGSLPYLDQLLTIRADVLGETHPDTISSLNKLGMLLYQQGDYAKGLSCFERELAVYKKLLEHPVIAQMLDNLGMMLDFQANYSGARPILKQVLASRQSMLGEEHPDPEASLLKEETEYLERLLYIRTQVLGESHADTISTLNDLGMLLCQQEQYAEAQSYFERELSACQQGLEEDHPLIAQALHHLGMTLYLQKDYTGARPILEQALAIRQSVLGEEHADTLSTLNNLGLLLHGRGDYTSAFPYFERVLTIQEQVLGETHPDTISSLKNIGELYHLMENYTQAQASFERLLAIQEASQEPNHSDIADIINKLGSLFYKQGNYGRAQACWERGLASCKQMLARNHLLTAKILNNLGMLFKAQAEYAKARPYFEQALAMAMKEARRGKKDPKIASYLHNLATLFYKQGNYAEAHACFERELRACQQELEEDHPLIARALNNLGMTLYLQKDYTGARPYLEQALAIRERVLGPEHAVTISTRQNLAELAEKDESRS